MPQDNTTSSIGDIVASSLHQAATDETDTPLSKTYHEGKEPPRQENYSKQGSRYHNYPYEDTASAATPADETGQDDNTPPEPDNTSNESVVPETPPTQTIKSKPPLKALVKFWALAFVLEWILFMTHFNVYHETLSFGSQEAAELLSIILALGSVLLPVQIWIAILSNKATGHSLDRFYRDSLRAILAVFTLIAYGFVVWLELANFAQYIANGQVGLPPADTTQAAQIAKKNERFALLCAVILTILTNAAAFYVARAKLKLDQFTH